MISVKKDTRKTENKMVRLDLNLVSIRKFEYGDIEKKVEWINNPLINEYLHYDIPITVDGTKKWFESKSANRYDCVIEYDGVPIGLIGLLQIDDVNQKAEYYISLGEIDYLGKGVASKATELILNYAFIDLQLNKVYLNVDADNSRACRFYDKSGFKKEGYFKKEIFARGHLIDRVRYAYYKENNKTQNDENCNILILSAGTRNKIVQYFKQSLAGNGIVIATDMSELAPALYEADKYYVVPPMNAPDYLETIYSICKENKIKGVFSLIDPELSLLAAHIEDFKKIGTTVIGSSYELCEMSLDKFAMYQWLDEHGYNCAKSWLDKEAFFKSIESGEYSFPVFVKPAKGSASISISKVYDKETVDLLFKHENGLMIQEFLNGQEIGADVYIDMISKEVVSIFTKKKIKMRAGETDKAVSVKNEKLFKFIEKFVLEAGYTGQIDIDIFEVDGEYYISEVNPRFGGGYPHSYESGCNHMALIINNLCHTINKSIIGDYDSGIYMMKYNEISIVKS